jgi:hypothetical protein
MSTIKQLVRTGWRESASYAKIDKAAVGHMLIACASWSLVLFGATGLAKHFPAVSEFKVAENALVCAMTLTLILQSIFVLRHMNKELAGGKASKQALFKAGFFMVLFGLGTLTGPLMLTVYGHYRLWLHVLSVLGVIFFIWASGSNFALPLAVVRIKNSVTGQVRGLRSYHAESSRYAWLLFGAGLRMVVTKLLPLAVIILTAAYFFDGSLLQINQAHAPALIKPFSFANAVYVTAMWFYIGALSFLSGSVVGVSRSGFLMPGFLIWCLSVLFSRTVMSHMTFLAASHISVVSQAIAVSIALIGCAYLVYLGLLLQAWTTQAYAHIVKRHEHQ